MLESIYFISSLIRRGRGRLANGNPASTVPGQHSSSPVRSSPYICDLQIYLWCLNSFATPSFACDFAHTANICKMLEYSSSLESPIVIQIQNAGVKFGILWKWLPILGICSITRSLRVDGRWYAAYAHAKKRSAYCGVDERSKCKPGVPHTRSDVSVYIAHVTWTTDIVTRLSSFIFCQ